MLYRFVSKVEHSLNIPILIVYALVNRPYILDLQEGRLLVANLLNLGTEALLEPIPELELAVAWHPDTISPVLSSFLDIVREVALLPNL